MTCGEIMTKNVSCCLPEDSMEQAAILMKSEDVGPIPVIESQSSRKLIGIVTDRDLVIKGIAEGRDAKSTKIRDVMTDQPIVCMENDDVKEAVHLMSDHQVRRIPVVDDKHQILGIIAQADVAKRAGKTKQTGEVVEKISE
jgi:CBS domain-containing protein